MAEGSVMFFIGQKLERAFFESFHMSEFLIKCLN